MSKENNVVKRSVTLPHSLSERIERICQQHDRPFTAWARMIFRSAVEKEESRPIFLPPGAKLSPVDTDPEEGDQACA